MQLISLTSNKNSFKTVSFKNKVGVNIIVAKQKDNNRPKKGKTFNGVGKSLMIAIIHFCLGSSSKNSFKEQLDDWEFTLRFSINDKEYSSRRSTNDQNKIFLNETELKLKDFKNTLEKLVFNIPEGSLELSFRSLLPFFIRPRKSSYVSEHNPNSIKKNFQVQITNALLLGLNTTLAVEKYVIKKEKERIRQLVKDLKDDKYINSFFKQNSDLDLTKRELEDHIFQLETDLNNFEVAEDYYEIREKADILKNDIEKLQNNITLNQIQIRNIEKSRKITPDIERKNIETIYNEAAVIINNQSLKTLAELEKFYTHITNNREKRLQNQKQNILNQIDELTTEKTTKSEHLNSKLQYLNAHHALDVFIKLSEQLSDLKRQHDNLTKFDELITKYNDENRSLDKQLIESSEETEKFLFDAKEILNQTNDFFRSLVKEFYPESKAGISVKNNEKDNQIRYDIEAKVEADKSDGISNVKLFCYDLTILLTGFNHKINFLFHDSRLLDGIDPRQTLELFKITNDYVKANNKQYILTVNQNQISEIERICSSPEEYNQLIKDNIILELNDDSPEEKLLGIQVDMDYD